MTAGFMHAGTQNRAPGAVPGDSTPKATNPATVPTDPAPTPTPLPARSPPVYVDSARPGSCSRDSRLRRWEVGGRRSRRQHRERRPRHARGARRVPAPAPAGAPQGRRQPLRPGERRQAEAPLRHVAQCGQGAPGGSRGHPVASRPAPNAQAADGVGAAAADAGAGPCRAGPAATNLPHDDAADGTGNPTP